MTKVVAIKFTEVSTIAIIALTILVVRLTISPQNFADFDSYTILTDYLAFRPRSEWLTFEPFSSALMLTLRAITGSGFDAVIYAHWILSISFVSVISYLLLRKIISWQAAVISFGVFGALLAFVLVRAMPAYFLVFFAVLDASRGKTRSLILLLLAIGFHISAILAAPALVAVLLQNRFKNLSNIVESRFVFLFTILLVLLLLIGSLPIFLNYINTLIGIFSPVIGKYGTYFEGANALANNQSAAITSSNHLYYVISVSAFLMVFLYSNNKACLRSRSYMIVSYVIFIILSISPVVAFRQSIFWLLPAVALFRWEDFHFSGFGTTFIIIIAGTAFYFGLSSALIP